MLSIELENDLKIKKAVIDRYLDKLLIVDGHIPVIKEAMRYSLFAGGKRLRPALSLMVCDLLGGKAEEVLPFACCIEMIHTYSLIHDDLPAMDNDDYRRGKLTSHKVYGEGYAVLAGDALLNKAYEIMFSHIKSNSHAKFIEAANLIAEAAGTEGMIGGQCIDIYHEDKPIDLETLKGMHNLKTGALINAALLAGAVISGAGTKDLASIRKYGNCIGLAFQIADDILDVEGSSEKLGKNTGSDSKKNKPTFVTLTGLQESKKTAGKLIEEAKQCISVYGENSHLLCDLADYIIDRDM